MFCHSHKFQTYLMGLGNQRKPMGNCFFYCQLYLSVGHKIIISQRIGFWIMIFQPFQKEIYESGSVRKEGGNVVYHSDPAENHFSKHFVIHGTFLRNIRTLPVNFIISRGQHILKFFHRDTQIYDIAGYCRISVDEEMDRDNTSIENPKAIIEDYVKQKFPGSTLTFYEDRGHSGYTFEKREGYQKMRPLRMGHQYDILIIKDFSRFSRRNSRGLVELEDLRDRGVRIISIGDNIDFPTDDDWTAIQFRFLVNEMPVTDTSKKRNPLLTDVRMTANGFVLYPMATS